ncbi:DUF192 domain-containing protein [Parasphingorhabdus cellanae]|uniref:DUF192 domain-containing protein n=1 Tax=Parasphingorhabdus cellanae TaxID=2806553 RepID=A0ABX7T1C4_9SPHN|nr:DUF192 domain-containing protein [Parasphingorhabdus cellanae]QTD54956.1 DUF192 domain-containing protein [Parasphingorhabdus cellanae]
MTGFFKYALWPALLLSSTGLTGCYAQAGNTDGKASQSQREESKLSEAGLRLIPLTVTSGTETHSFTVELAKTSQEQARGLMFRTELAPDRGMIFPFVQERMASFWMKNTVIPLDIIFVRSDGTIESIAANTTPYSLDPVRSGEPVAAVLELAGGRAAELGISAGDKVEW